MTDFDIIETRALGLVATVVVIVQLISAGCGRDDIVIQAAVVPPVMFMLVQLARKMLDKWV